MDNSRSSDGSWRLRKSCPLAALEPCVDVSSHHPRRSKTEKSSPIYGMSCGQPISVLTDLSARVQVVRPEAAQADICRFFQKGRLLQVDNEWSEQKALLAKKLRAFGEVGPLRVVPRLQPHCPKL